MRKILVIILLGIIALIAVPQIVLAGSHDDHDDLGGHRSPDHELGVSRFNLRLTGSEQAPAVNETSFGHARLRLVDNNTLLFSLVVCNIANVTHAHIHFGSAGANGPIVVPLFDEANYPFSVTHGCATLAAGVRTPSDLLQQSGAGINTWNDFLNALLTNHTYINVHTTAHPGGEIRGQLILRGGLGHDRDGAGHIEHDDADDDE
jgi:hypothetical protein